MPETKLLRSLLVVVPVTVGLVFTGLAVLTALPTETNTSPTGAGVASARLSPSDKAGIAEAYGKLSLSFEANRGQTNSQVDFLARGAGYSLFLTPT